MSFAEWINEYFYKPKFSQIALSLFLAPFSLIYCAFSVSIFLIRSKLLNTKIPSAAVISVGNLTVGGSGKTPLVKAIFSLYHKRVKTFIVLRGYKRHSKGLIIVSNHGHLLSNYSAAGDEAMEYATTLSDANVIVSEDKLEGIRVAENLGARLILLDDGFSRSDIHKLDILMPPPVAPFMSLTLPSGAWRYPKSFFKYADFIPNSGDIKSEQSIKNATDKMVLVTAIANPARLKDAFSRCVGVQIFMDHHEFKKSELDALWEKFKPTSFLVTAKDFVKLEQFGYPLSVLELKTQISPEFGRVIDNFLASRHQNSSKELK